MDKVSKYREYIQNLLRASLKIEESEKEAIKRVDNT